MTVGVSTEGETSPSVRPSLKKLALVPQSRLRCLLVSLLAAAATSFGTTTDKGQRNNRLFHDQVIPYGFDPFYAPCDVTRFIGGFLRINEAAQLNGSLESFDTDLE